MLLDCDLSMYGYKDGYIDEDRYNFLGVYYFVLLVCWDMNDCFLNF